MKNQPKILIFNIFPLRRGGGPSGYLYNIKYSEEYKKYSDKIHFLTDFVDFSFLYNYFYRKMMLNNIKIIYYYLLYKIISKKNFLKIILEISNHFKKNHILIDKFFKSINLDLSSYKYIHFHTFLDFLIFKSYFQEKWPNINIIYQIHTPGFTIFEIIEDWFKLNKREIDSKTLRNLISLEISLFDAADIIIFPAKCSLDSYLKNKEFRDFYRNNKQKFKYLITPFPLLDLSSFDTPKEIRKKYDIPVDSFVICFMGRHIRRKGYDLLKRFGKIILSKYEDVFFVVGGGGPIKGLNHSRWHELGYTDKSLEVMYASDIIINPSRFSYFDLVNLEAMSLNKPLFLSYGGGNRFFSEDKCDVFFFKNNSVEDMISVFENKIYKKEINRNRNRKWIEQYHNFSSYFENYYNLLLNINKKKK